MYHFFLRNHLPTRNEIRTTLNQTRQEENQTLKRIWGNFKRFSTRLVYKIYRNLPRKLQYLVRALKKFDNSLHNKLVCLQPTIKRRMGNMNLPKEGMGKYNGMPIKRYGYGYE